MQAESQYLEYNENEFLGSKIPEITIHGRFQPPLHKNHFETYIKTALKISEKIKILIVIHEVKDCKIAPHRNLKENNPLTYEERVLIFKKFFKKIGIKNDKISFIPFNINDDSEFQKKLSKDVPNLINTYGKWSEKKLERFQELGFKVIHSKIPKRSIASGTLIRKILNGNSENKREELIDSGLMPEITDEVMDIWKKKG